MTRETKIGLLVGLAFIIVIGILLSDHLTSATEPPQAELAQAGSNVRQAVSTPGGSAVQAPAVTTSTMVTPQQQIPTREEMNPKPQPAPIAIVHIGPQAGAERSAAPDLQPKAPTQPPTQTPPIQVVANDPPITRAPEVPAKSALTEVAKAFNEQIVAVPARTDAPTGVALQAESPANTRKYKAESGDSVSRLAAKFLGGNTKANRDAIVQVNSSLQKDANKIIIAQTYNIPVMRPDAGAERSAAPDRIVSTSPAAKPPASAAGEYLYTVKPGDSLSKIALEQLGSTSTVAAIKELNRDVLKDENSIVVNMKLRLPAKPLASAQ